MLAFLQQKSGVELYFYKTSNILLTEEYLNKFIRLDVKEENNACSFELTLILSPSNVSCDMTILFLSVLGKLPPYCWIETRKSLKYY